MNEQTVALILALLPVAEKIIFKVGSKLIELNTDNLSHDALIAAIEQSKSSNWPKLSFKTPE